MNSISILKNFAEDLKRAKTEDKDEVIMTLIQERLDACLNTYITTLNKDITYLQHRNQLKLARKLSK